MRGRSPACFAFVLKEKCSEEDAHTPYTRLERSWRQLFHSGECFSTVCENGGPAHSRLPEVMTEATVPDHLNDKEKSKTPLNHVGLHSLARETLSRVVLESHFLC